MNPNLYIIGGESTAIEIREVAELYYASKYHRIINVIKDGAESNLKDYISDSEFKQILQRGEIGEYIISFIDVKLRHFFLDLLKDFPTMNEATIIHPTAFISPSASIGNGTYLAAFAVISSNAKVGKRCLINYQSVIGHDVIVGNDCVLNPGAKLSGHVQIGNDGLIGANSMVYAYVTLGDNVFVDSMTYVRTNIDSNSICSSRLDAKLNIFKNRIYC